MKRIVAVLTSFALLVAMLAAFPASNVYANSTAADEVYNDPNDEIQIVKEYSSLDLDVSKVEPRAEGNSEYVEFIRKYDFADVSGYYKKAATELAALGISYGTGGGNFGAMRDIKNIEAIAMFLRMFGAHEAVHKRVMDKYPGASMEDLNPYIYDEYVVEAQNLGILPKGESLAYYQPAKRQDIAKWFVRSANLKNPEPSKKLESASDRGLIKSSNYESVQTLVDLGIMSINFGNAFGANLPIHRQDFAMMLEKTVDRFESNLKLEKAYGMVIGLKRNEDDKGSFTDVLLRTPENKVESIRFGERKNGTKIGFATLNGGLISPWQIQKGMELEYLIRDKKVILARVLHHDDVKRQLVENFASDKDVEIIQGEVKSNLLDEVNTKDKKLQRRRIRTELDDDRMVDFLGERDLISGVDNSILLKKGSSFIPPESLKKGDSISAYIKNDKLLFLQVGRENAGVNRGELRMISQSKEPNKITILNYDGRVQTFDVSEDTNFTVNHYEVGLKDLKPGAHVTVISLGGVAEFVRAQSYQPPEGYIERKGKILYATVKKLSGNEIALNGDVDSAKVSPMTLLKKDGKDISLKDIVAGDKLKLYYDDIYSDSPSKIVVEKYGAIVKKLVKAKVTNYSKATESIELSNPYYMVNAKWLPEKGSYVSKYKLAHDIEVYAGGRKIDAADISPDYVNKLAYMVVRDNYNSKEIAKLVFGSGYERSFSDELSSFDNDLNRMRLAEGKTLLYADETIFVENDRIVSKSNLRNDVNLQITSNDLGGVDTAKVVQILGPYDDIYKRIFAGTIENVNTYSIEISDYAGFKNLKFAKTDEGEKRLELSDETSIYDFEKQKNISRLDLFNGDYYKKEQNGVGNKGLKFKRYYGFFITDGKDNLLATKLRYKGLIENDLIDDKPGSESYVGKKIDEILKRLTLTRGTIGQFETKWTRIGLYNSFNYFDFHGEWRANDKSTIFSVRNAIIIKDGKSVEYRDLRLDDKVYVIRDDDDGLVVFVE